MKLRYKAVSIQGKTAIGVIDAKDITEAASYLRNKKMTPILIVPEHKGGLIHLIPFFGKTKSTDVVYFTRQLSSMLNSGLTLVQSLALLKDQVQNPAMSEIVSGTLADIEEGKSFSQAIERFPDVFSHVFVSSIKASEESGLLDKVLLRLADNLEKNEKLKSTIKGALLYPIIVIMGMIAVIIIMMVFVIPQISVLYADLGVELPLPTLIILGLSSFFINFWPLMIGMIFLGGFLFRRWHKTETGQLIIDEYILKLPIFGKLIRQSILTEFSRTLGLLIGSGTLVVDAIKQASEVTGNIIYRNAILNVAKRVEKGVPIGDSMSASILFPPILVQMSRIGEETGKVDESLLKVSEYFEHEVDQTVKTLTTAMEPFIMVMLGLGVGFLLFAVITPIYGIISKIA